MQAGEIGDAAVVPGRAGRSGRPGADARERARLFLGAHSHHDEVSDPICSVRAVTPIRDVCDRSARKWPRSAEPDDGWPAILTALEKYPRRAGASRRHRHSTPDRRCHGRLRPGHPTCTSSDVIIDASLRRPSALGNVELRRELQDTSSSSRLVTPAVRETLAFCRSTAVRHGHHWAPRATWPEARRPRVRQHDKTFQIARRRCGWSDGYGR